MVFWRYVSQAIFEMLTFKKPIFDPKVKVKVINFAFLSFFSLSGQYLKNSLDTLSQKILGPFLMCGHWKISKLFLEEFFEGWDLVKPSVTYLIEKRLIELSRYVTYFMKKPRWLLLHVMNNSHFFDSTFLTNRMKKSVFLEWIHL